MNYDAAKLPAPVGKRSSVPHAHLPRGLVLCDNASQASTFIRAVFSIAEKRAIRPSEETQMFFRSTSRSSVLIDYLLILAAITLLAGCGPSAANGGDEGWFEITESSPTEDEESDANISANSDDASSTDSVDAASQTGLSVAPGSQEVDDEGIPVGFTTDGFPFRGDPEAPIVMEEYSDYQCPFCNRFVQETLPSIAQNQIANGEVVLVFYDFPLPSHPQAPAAHEAAYCAGEEGAAAYWAMHDALFDNLANWENQSDTTTLFTGYAGEIGLDVEQFRSCLESGQFTERVEAGIAAGAQRGVNSTPSFFLNGQLIRGAQPLATFNQAIETISNGGQLAGAAQQPATRQPGVEPTPAAVNDEVAAALGDPNAPVTIVEFTDYQCPYCARHAEQTFPQLLEQYIETGEVYYVVKDFPLDSIHPFARTAAAAVRCAGEQDAYWEMHDEVFAQQPLWSGNGADTSAVLTEIAAELNLETDSFDSCLDSGRYDAAVEANFAEGRSLGVSATPTFFINGYPVPGAQPLEVFDFAISLAAEGRLGEAYVEQQQEAPPEPDPSQPVDIPLGDAPSIGDPDAPVVIVEYTDFQCPYCSRHFQQTFPQIVENFVETGQVLYVFKDFPLTSIHPQAMLAAEAARCARDQSAYLEMHDMLFARQGEWNNRGNAADLFVGYAGELDLDTETFAACLESREHQAGVMADLDEGSSFGIRGTPGFFINGHFLSGAQPYPVFEQAIQQLLAEAE
jgi:protein-disulfide isomerase